MGQYQAECGVFHLDYTGSLTDHLNGFTKRGHIKIAGYIKGYFMGALPQAFHQEFRCIGSLWHDGVAARIIYERQFLLHTAGLGFSNLQWVIT